MIDGNRAFSLLFMARFFRMYSYGLISVILYLFLLEIGLTNVEIGALYSSTMVGDIVLTFILTTRADSWGRRRTLMVGAALKLLAGITFVSSTNVFVLIIAGTIGVITPSGKEVGPFQPVEQAALTEIIEAIPGRKEKIARLFGLYQLVGSVAGAVGALSSGWVVTLVHLHTSISLTGCYRIVILMYSVIGAAMSILYYALPNSVETVKPPGQVQNPKWFGKFGLRRPESRAVVFRLSILFVLDAFGGGFILSSMTSAWFRIRYGLSEGLIGSMLMGSELMAGLSALAVTPLVEHFGAIHTMVATHAPSHIFLILIPFMPTSTSAVVMLILRSSISQMDAPARQAYVAMVVDPDERSAAGGITNLVRSIGLAISPFLASIMLDHPHSAVFLLPYILAASLKLIYDLCMFLSFRFHDVGKTSDAIVIPIPILLPEPEVSQEDVNSSEAKSKEENSGKIERHEIELDTFSRHDGDQLLLSDYVASDQ